MPDQPGGTIRISGRARLLAGVCGALLAAPAAAQQRATLVAIAPEISAPASPAPPAVSKPPADGARARPPAAPPKPGTVLGEKDEGAEAAAAEVLRILKRAGDGPVLVPRAAPAAAKLEPQAGTRARDEAAPVVKTLEAAARAEERAQGTLPTTPAASPGTGPATTTAPGTPAEPPPATTGTGTPPAGRGDDAELRRVFEMILRDPGNPGLNLRYARLSIDRGDLARAISAYERILARDPDNAEAKAGLARARREAAPDITRLTTSLGVTYESNPRHFLRQSERTQDGTFAARIDFFDERRLGQIRWRTEADLYANYHLRFHDIDYGTVGGRTGPLLAFDEKSRIHIYAGGSYAWLARRTFYGEATAGVTLEFDDLAPLRSVGVRGGYDFVGASFSTRDAVFVEVTPRFSFPDVGYPGTTVWVNPYWRYNGVNGTGAPGLNQNKEPFPARFHQFGFRTDYFLPVSTELTFGLNFTYEYRHYYENVINDNKHRRDHLVAPGVQAIVGNIIDPRLDIIFSYGFEHRFTNDRLQLFSNHSAGVRVLWRQ